MGHFPCIHLAEKEEKIYHYRSHLTVSGVHLLAWLLWCLITVEWNPYQGQNCITCSLAKRSSLSLFTHSSTFKPIHTKKTVEWQTSSSILSPTYMARRCSRNGRISNFLFKLRKVLLKTLLKSIERPFHQELLPSRRRLVRYRTAFGTEVVRLQL